MAWTPKVWVDRAVQHTGRFILTATGNANEYDLTRVWGTVFTEGDKPNAANLNAEFGNVKTELDAISTNLTVNYGTCTTYSATATYAVNSLIIYSGVLYKCTTAITVAEAWTASHWAVVTSESGNNGMVYNSTDSSFYGVRGAGAVIPFSKTELLQASMVSVGGSAGSWAIANNSYTIVKTGKHKLLLYGNGQDGNNNKYQKLYKNNVEILNIPTQNILLEFDLVVGDVIRYENKCSFGAGSYTAMSYMAIFK